MFGSRIIRTILQTRHFRQGVALLLSVAIGLLVIVLIGDEGDSEAGDAESVTTEIMPRGPFLPAAEPQALRIPALSLTIPFSRPLGVDDTGMIEVPTDYESVGYYKHGPTPGELGPAVVLGHVDSYVGPAVLYSLGQLEVGDEIFIDRADNTTAIFTVTKLERIAQREFPTARVYGDIDHAGLRIVTCSGWFDREAQEYSHNLIVYAELSPEN